MLPVSSDIAGGNVRLKGLVFPFIDVAFSLFPVDGNALFALQVLLLFKTLILALLRMLLSM